MLEIRPIIVCDTRPSLVSAYEVARALACGTIVVSGFEPAKPPPVPAVIEINSLLQSRSCASGEAEYQKAIWHDKELKRRERELWKERARLNRKRKK